MKDTLAIRKLGHPELDQQHAQLLLCLENLREFVDGSYSFSAGFSGIQTLLAYTEEHFAYEENLLRQWGYPKLDEHIVQHESLINEVRQQWERVEREGEDIAREIIETIESWIVAHINGSDFEFKAIIC